MNDLMKDAQDFQSEIKLGEQEPMMAVPCGSREKPDGQLDPAGEAGWYLQRERELRGESLEHVGQQIAIHPYHIEAIEYGDMTHMPPRLESLEMIAAYAHYLGFEAEPLIAHYVQFLPKPAVMPSFAHPANPPPLSSAKILAFSQIAKFSKLKFGVNGIPGNAGGIVVAVAGAMLLFAGASWMMLSGPQSDPQTLASKESIEEVDPMATASTGAVADINPAKTTARETTPTSPARAGAIPEGDLDGLGAFIKAKVPVGKQSSLSPGTANGMVKKSTAGNAMTEDMAQTAGGRIFGASNPDARLVLKAKAPVWIRVEDGQGNLVMTQLLAKGDVYKVPDRDGLVVIARDGGLLTYMIDGEDKGMLGTPGEVLIGRSLDVASFAG